MQTESQVKTEGVDLGKMNAMLLQKVEELTLYVIEQQQQINMLKKYVSNIDDHSNAK